MVSVWPNARVVHVCMCGETFFDTVFPHSSFTIWGCAVEESLLHLPLLNTCSCTISLPHVAFSTLNNLCKEKFKKMPFFCFGHLCFYVYFLMFFRYSVYCGCCPFKEENFGVLLYEGNEGH